MTSNTSVSSIGETMRRIASDDGLTVKYIHDSGLETTIKKKVSCNGVFDPAAGRIRYEPAHKPYYSVFMSSSVGCRMLCGFCYLTAMDMHYKPVSADVIINDVIAAIKDECENDPSMRTKLAKLSWMGMGEEFSAHPNEWVNTTKNILRQMQENSLAGGVIGCDVATVFPKSVNWEYFYTKLTALNSYMASSDYCLSVREGPQTRIFWSIPVIGKSLRQEIMPGTGHVSDIVEFINNMDARDVGLVLHHFFIKGVNDHQEDLDALIRLVESLYRPIQLRLLRFNQHPCYKFPETPDFESCAIYVAKALKNVRVQESSGADIKAACGMFRE